VDEAASRSIAFPLFSAYLDRLGTHSCLPFANSIIPREFSGALRRLISHDSATRSRTLIRHLFIIPSG